MKAKKEKTYWAVMIAEKFSSSLSSSIFGLKVNCNFPKDGPQRFIPVFDTYEQAVKWNGSKDNVVQLATIK